MNQLDKFFVPVLAEPGSDQLHGDGGRMLNFMRGTNLYVDMSGGKVKANIPTLVKCLGDRGIGKALAGSEIANVGDKDSILGRVAQLEKENKDLKALADKLTKRVVQLEKKLKR